jgi:hypothetical protein
VFENRVLRRIFGPKRDEVMGDRRKLHNEELHNLYFSPHIIRMIKSRRMRWAGHVARMEEKKNAYRILVGKPELVSAVSKGPFVPFAASYLCEFGCVSSLWNGLLLCIFTAEPRIDKFSKVKISVGFTLKTIKIG